jgi:hypothetical protein
MRFTLSLVLLTGLAVVSHGSPKKLPPAKPAVPVLKADAVDSLAVKQVISASPELGVRVATPVSSLEKGLLYARKASKRPIVTMAESKGWFFYATSVAQDAKTGKPVYLISECAIKRNGCRIVGWSVWLTRFNLRPPNTFVGQAF